MISPISSLYSADAGYSTRIGASRSALGSSSGMSATAGGAAESAQVAISEAARQAAKKDAAGREGYQLPESVRALVMKELPADVMAEAKARLAEAGVGAEGPMNLPLVPENQDLLHSFQEEMRTIRAKGLADATPEDSARFNQLLNLTARLQLVGWQKPMAEADVQRELDISLAMGRLSAEGAASNAGGKDAVPDQSDSFARELGTVPQVWRDRWSREELVMPGEVALPPGKSLWLAVAEAAGIGGDEFMTKARDLATTRQGSALTEAVEHFISDRYQALKAAQEHAVV